MKPLVRVVRILTAIIAALGVAGAGNAEAAISASALSACDKPGPHRLRENPDLLRDDIRVEAMEEPPLSRTTGRTPAKEKQASRGVCQDPRTGRTVFEKQVNLRSLRQLPAEDGDTGGDEGTDRRPRLGSGSEPRLMAPAEDDGLGDDEGSGFSPKKVIGADQRVLITNTTQFPNRAIVKLIMTFENDPNTPKKTFGCTGSFIGGFHVLTAGHCVFKQPGGSFPNIFGWADSVLVIPGFDGGAATTKPFGQTFVTKPLRSFKSWTNDGDTEGDIGLITLNKTFTVGSFGLSYASDSTLDNTQIYLWGYPGELGNPLGTQQWGVPEGSSVSDYDSGIVFYTMDTSKGQSGSGVYRFKNNKRAIIAVHHGECNSENCGARITKNRHDVIRGWQCKDGASISGIC